MCDEFIPRILLENMLKHRLFCLFKTNEKDKQINTINT